MSEQIDKLLGFISSTAESIKILAGTDLPQVKEVLYDNRPLDGPPSRASAAEFALRGIKGRNLQSSYPLLLKNEEKR